LLQREIVCCNIFNSHMMWKEVNTMLVVGDRNAAMLMEMQVEF
jgi:3-oxoacyl-[acyl-carrier-protein] synthase III